MSDAVQQRRYLGHHLPTKLRSSFSLSGPCSPDPVRGHPHFPCKTARPTVNGPLIFFLHPPQAPPHRKNCVSWHNPHIRLNHLYNSPRTGTSHTVNWEFYMQLKFLSWGPPQTIRRRIQLTLFICPSALFQVYLCLPLDPFHHQTTLHYFPVQENSDGHWSSHEAAS